VESSCACDNELSGSKNSEEFSNIYTTGEISSCAELNRVTYLILKSVHHVTNAA
jgi:hypothetical protein